LQPDRSRGAVEFENPVRVKAGNEACPRRESRMVRIMLGGHSQQRRLPRLSVRQALDDPNLEAQWSDIGEL
jgi:hypothetical protein